MLSEYDQEIQKSQTADKPMTPRERTTQPSRDTRKTNHASKATSFLSHQDDSKTKIGNVQQNIQQLRLPQRE